VYPISGSILWTSNLYGPIFGPIYRLLSGTLVFGGFRGGFAGTDSSAGVTRSGKTGGFPRAGKFRPDVHLEKAYHAHTD
jgi:hypothetical protein